VDAWSIYHSIWPDNNAELHIIDSEGQSHTFHINDPVSDAWNALLPSSNEEDAEEEASVEEEEEEDEEGVEEEADIEPPSTPVSEAPVAEAPATEAPATDATPIESVSEASPASVTAEPANDAPLETVTVTLESLANLDIAHLSGV